MPSSPCSLIFFASSLDVTSVSLCPVLILVFDLFLVLSNHRGADFFPSDNSTVIVHFPTPPAAMIGPTLDPGAMQIFFCLIAAIVFLPVFLIVRVSIYCSYLSCPSADFSRRSRSVTHCTPSTPRSRWSRTPTRRHTTPKSTWTPPPRTVPSHFLASPRSLPTTTNNRS